MTNEPALREQLVELLDWHHAHVDLESVLKRISFDALGKKTPGSPYTIWELLEHIRIAQADIVSFSRSADHQSPPFPEGYWPEDRAPESDEEWQRAREGLKNDLEAMKRLVADPEQDLLAPIPHGDGQTLLREAVLLADHNAYHLGQIVLMLKMLKLW